MPHTLIGPALRLKNAASAASRQANAPVVTVAKRCLLPYDASGRIDEDILVGYGELVLSDRHPDVIALRTRLPHDDAVRAALRQRGWRFGGDGHPMPTTRASGWWTPATAAAHEPTHAWFSPRQAGLHARAEAGGRRFDADEGTEIYAGRMQVHGWSDVVRVRRIDYRSHAPAILPRGPWATAVEVMARIAGIDGLRGGQPVRQTDLDRLADHVKAMRGGSWSPGDWLRGGRCTAVRIPLAEILRTGGHSAAARLADPATATIAPATEQRLNGLAAAIADETQAQVRALSDYTGHALAA